MKRTILLFTLSLLTLSLASCNNGKENEEVSKPDPEVNVPDKPSVPETKPDEPATPTPPTFDEDILKYNEPEERHQIEFDDTKIILKDPSVPKEYAVYGEPFRSDDFAVTKVVNKLGYVGLYNLTLGEMIVNPQYDIDVLEDFTKTSGIFNLTIEEHMHGYPELLLFLINYEDTSLVIDALGNVLYEGELLDKGKINYVYDEYFDGFHFSPNLETTQPKTYIYDDGKLLTLDDLEEGANYPGRQKIELSMYGLPGYIGYFDEESAIITDLNNVEVNKYYYGFNGEYAYRYDVTLVDGYLVWQEMKYVTPLDPNYNYEDDLDRTLVRDFRQNVLTGEIEVKDATRKIYNMEALKDKDGVYKYLLVDSRAIENKLAVGPHETHLCDKELNQLKDYSGNPQFNSRRIGNYYINSRTIYDLEFNFVANYPRGITIEYAINDGENFVFSTSMDNYGLMDSKGFVLIEPKYKSFIADDNLNYYFVCNEKTLSVLDKETLKPVKEFECFYPTLDLISKRRLHYYYLAFSNSTQFVLLDTNTLEEIVLKDEAEGIHYKKPNSSFVDLDYAAIFDNSNELINLVRLNDPVITPYGVEGTTRTEDGSSYFKPIILTEESSEITPTLLNETKFYKYEIKTSGLYELENFDRLYKFNGSTNSFEEILKPGANRQALFEGDELYFKETFESLEKYNLTVKLVNEFTPIVLEGETLSDASNIYRTIESTKDQYITFKSDSGLDIMAKKVDEEHKLIDAETFVENGKTYYVLEKDTSYLFALTSLAPEGLDYKVTLLDILEKDLFEVSEADTRYFVYDETLKGYKSTNKAPSSSSNLLINIHVDGEFVFNYKVSSEQIHDSLYVQLNGRDIFKLNGEESGTKKVAVKKGDRITFSYRKDSSVDRGSDEAIVNAFHIAGFEEISGIEKVSS